MPIDVIEFLHISLLPTFFPLLLGFEIRTVYITYYLMLVGHFKITDNARGLEVHSFSPVSDQRVMSGTAAPLGHHSFPGLGVIKAAMMEKHVSTKQILRKKALDSWRRIYKAL